MPVFDFNDEPKEEKKAPECTYTVIRSNETEASSEHPILVLDNSSRKWEHHSWGVFTNPVRKTAFEFQAEGGGTVSADILKVDARFVSLLKWPEAARSCTVKIRPLRKAWYHLQRRSRGSCIQHTHLLY